MEEAKKISRKERRVSSKRRKREVKIIIRKIRDNTNQQIKGQINKIK